MSDYDRGKYSGKKKITLVKEPATGTSPSKNYYGKTNTPSSKVEKDSMETNTSKVKQPTILLKAREPTDEIATSPKRPNRENDMPSNITIATSSINEAINNPPCKAMTKSIKFLDENLLCTESLQDYLQENSDFLVIAVVGAQSVGKSTIMNMLAHNVVTDNLKKTVFRNLEDVKEEQYGDNIKILTENINNLNVSGNDNIQTEVFKVQTSEDIEKNQNVTNGIDIFITSNRIILLDCQPLCSVSVLHDLIENEHKRSTLVSEFIPSENSCEIQGLQYSAFLLSICHIMIVVQDWFFDSNIIRLIQTAEMLKPSVTNPEDELVDNAPHLVLIHNKAAIDDFTPRRFKMMQDTYSSLFNKSKLHLDTNLGLACGKFINYLNKQNSGSPINLFLIPHCNPNTYQSYNGHPGIEELMKQLKANLFGASKNALTHVQLTEKTWLTFCLKMWESVKKSSFFVEYTKLMP